MFDFTDTRPHIEERGMYYKVAGDPRWHTDNARLEALRKTIPSRAEDTCPQCGRVGVDGCRCYRDHRYCPTCKVSWIYVVDMRECKIKRQME